LRAEYVVASAPPGQLLSSLSTGVSIRSLGSVSDSARGLDTFSVQQNMITANRGLQNCLRVYHDHLEWLIDLFDTTRSPSFLMHQEEVTLDSRNVDAVRDPFMLIEFFTGFVGDQFLMSMKLYNSVQLEIMGLERMLEPKYDERIVSGYLTFAGEGNGSFAQFGQLDAIVVHETDVNTTPELNASYVPAVAGDPPLAVFSTAESSNTYQEIELVTATEVRVKVGVGPWI
jgi:hypothetical protein